MGFFSSPSRSKTLSQASREYSDPATFSAQLFSTTANLCVRLISFSLNLSLLNHIPACREAAVVLVVVVAGAVCQLPNQFQLQPSTLSDCRPASPDKELLAGGVAATGPALLREETLRQNPRRTQTMLGLQHGFDRTFI